MSDNTTLKSVLQRRGHSLTESRKQVFEALLSPAPLSMSELIKRTAGHVDRASVYRIIGLFESLGIVTRLQSGWKYRLELGDQFQPHHHHMYCAVCGNYSELPADNALEAQLNALAESSGFTTYDHQIEIRGMCRNCHDASSGVPSYFKRPGSPKPL